MRPRYKPTRPSQRFLTVLGMLFALVAGPLLVTPAQAVFGPSGISGGGFENVVAPSPPAAAASVQNRILTRADVAGFHVSDDQGVTWHPSNAGLVERQDRGIAAIEWNRGGTRDVFALTGFEGKQDGSVVWSNDGGDNWQVLWGSSQTPPVGAGANERDRPRPTGRLIAWVNSNLIYVGGTTGLFRFSRADVNQPWCQASPCGRVAFASDGDGANVASTRIRGVFVTAPGASQRLYVAVQGLGLYRFSDLDAATPTRGSVETGPGGVFADRRTLRSLAFADDKLYVAAGTSGFFVCDAPAAGPVTGCAARNAGLPLGTAPGKSLPRDWSTVDALLVGSEVQAYIGSGESGGGAPVYRRQGGGDWVPLAQFTTNVLVAGGGGGPQWWLSQKAPDLMWTGGNNDIGQISIDRAVPSRVYVASRSGVWRKVDQDGDLWRPAVNGLSDVVARQVVSDLDGGVVLETDVDWTATQSGSQLAFSPQPKNTIVSPNASGYVAAVTDTRLYVGTGGKDSTTPGVVWSCARTAAGCQTEGGWISEGLEDVSGGNTVLGVAVGRLRATDAWQIVAAVENKGIYRKVGSQAWQRVSATVAAGTGLQNNRVDIVFREGSRFVYVYVYDGRKGVFRSGDLTNAATTWQFQANPLWQPPNPGTDSQDTYFMAAAPATSGQPTALYVTSPTAAVKLTNIESSVSTTNPDGTAGPEEALLASPSVISSPDLIRPGPITVDSTGRVLIAQQGGVVRSNGVQLRRSRLFRAISPGGMALEDISDEGFQQQAVLPTSIATTTNTNGERTIYVSDRGSGVAVRRGD